MLPRFESQSVLFSPAVSRQDLLEIELSETTERTCSVNVWRNHAFETLPPLMQPYFSFGSWKAEFNLGSYDDTLLMAEWSQADAELLWLDSDRYLKTMGFEEWLAWLHGRLVDLRARSAAPVVLATWLSSEEQVAAMRGMLNSVPAAYFADLLETGHRNKVDLLDQRTARLTGSPVSNAAQVVVARELACRWLPSLLLPPIKAVALDLDQTLHEGVLGEDGIEGVRLTSEHAGFQSAIKALHDKGIFLALVSRNEYSDVEELFRSRADYPLRWEDFSSIKVNWDDKASNIAKVAEELRISHDAVLFVDDNIGELSSIMMQLPDVHAAFAHQDASITQMVVDYYPGLWRWSVGEDDLKRIHDLKANAERARIQTGTMNMSEYYRSLEVSLFYRYDPLDQQQRLYDLCKKTNQFNLALKRSSQVEVDDFLRRDDACIVSVQLTDKLTDSGVIAVIVAERAAPRLIVRELCISCRALGRQLENIIILNALSGMSISEGCDEVVFDVQQGPRNMPAIKWLSDFVGQEIDVSTGEVGVSAHDVRAFQSDPGVVIRTE